MKMKEIKPPRLYQRKHLQLMMEIAYQQLEKTGASEETLKLLDAVLKLYEQYQWDYEDPDIAIEVNDLADDIQDVKYEEQKPYKSYEKIKPLNLKWKTYDNLKVKNKKSKKKKVTKKAQIKSAVPVSVPITGELPRKISW
jgi:hypothetical protein